MVNFSELQVPANLFLEQLLDEFPPKDKRVSIDGLAHLCHTIIHLQSRYKDDILTNRGFVRLNSTILARFNIHYHSCSDYLVDHGVIETDNHYVVGEKSKGYRLTSKYRGCGFKPIKPLQRTFKKRLTRLYRQEAVAREETLKGYTHLVRCFKTNKLSINKIGAYRWIDNFLQATAQQQNNSSDEFMQELQHTCDLYRLSVNNVLLGNYYCSVDQTSYRFHSVLTNLKKELRHFINYDQKTLVSIDIKNSQPFFTLLLLQSSFYLKIKDRHDVTLGKVDAIFYEYLQHNGTLSKIRKLLNGTALPVISGLDVREYRSQVLEGTFYETFGKSLEIEYGIIRSRDQIKQRIFMILYGKPKSVCYTKEYKLFQRKFPTVLAIFNLLKGREYTDLAILLQTIESNMVLKKVTKSFHRKFPRAPIFTIHDCVVTDLAHCQPMEEVLKQTLQSYIGFTPTLSQEIWQNHVKIEER